MSQYADCYFLVNSRSPELAIQFLDRFLPGRIQSAEKYILGSRPEKIFLEPLEIMQVLETIPGEIHSMYWHNRDKSSSFEHGYVFHTDDGKMILGFSIPARNPDESLAIQCYREGNQFLNAEWSCITIEEMAPLNSE